MAVYLVRRSPLINLPTGPVSLRPDHPLAANVKATALYRGQYGDRVAMPSTVPAFSMVSAPYADGGGFRFDGTDDYLTSAVPARNAFPITTMVWATPHVTTTGIFVSQGDTTGSFPGFCYLGAHTATNFLYNIRCADGDVDLTADLPVGGVNVVNQLVCLVGVSVGRAEHLFYVNGVLVDTSAVDCGLVSGGVPSWNNVTVGAMLRTSASSFANVSVRQWAIFDKALTAGQIWDLYDARTRWSLYWTPSRAVYFDLATGKPWHYYAQQMSA